MKKLTLVLAAFLAAAMCVTACTSEKQDSTTTTKSTTPQATTTTTATVTTTTEATTTTGTSDGPATPNTPSYTPVESVTVDGDLSEWEGTKTISIIGSDSYAGKTAVWYAAVLEDGLYLACDAYHDIFKTNGNAWHENSNFEIFVSSQNTQYWASAKGMSDTNTVCMKSDNLTSAVMVSTALTDADTAYHTVTEVFISNDKLPSGAVSENGIVRVGVAWKTLGDDCNNCGNNNVDNWWTPIGTKTNNNPSANQAVVTNCGIYTMAEYRDSVSTAILEAGSEWSYLTATKNPDAAGENWNTVVNADWEKANAPFGNRAPGATNAWGTSDNPADGTQANAYLWVVKEFTVTDLASLGNTQLLCSMFYDDTFTLYINGQVVFEDKDNESWNGGYETYKLADNIADLLNEGTNVIAASLHQHHGGYEFDLSLFTTDDPLFVK